MDKEEPNLLGVIARYGQVNESRDGCDLGERGATQGLGGLASSVSMKSPSAPESISAATVWVIPSD